jgi:hypothetical protein
MKYQINLSELCLKYPLTDKGPLKADGTPGHNYTETYEIHFGSIREYHLKILEIGFGGGDSLKLWADYFKNADIFCIDKDLSRIEQYGYVPNKRISILYGDQSSSDSLVNACKLMGVDRFDIIIDDGSHVKEHILTTFGVLFEDYLSPGGIYFIEDFPNVLDLSSPLIDSVEYCNELTTVKRK